MNFMKKIMLSISTFSFILLTACGPGSDSTTFVFAYVAQFTSVSSQNIINRFAINTSTGLLSSNPATAYSSTTQQFTQLTLATVNGVKYAYVTDQNNGLIYQCTINGTDGSFNTCTSAYAGSPGWNPRGIVFATVNSVQYAYVTDTNGLVYQCTLNSNGSFNSCTALNPTFSPNPSVIFSAPYGITFATVNSIQYAYVSDATGYVFQCSLDSAGSFTTCTPTPTSGAPNWIPYATAFATVNGTQYAYVANNGGSSAPPAVYLCTLNIDGSFNSCHATPSSSVPSWAPFSISFATLMGKQYAYVTNFGPAINGNVYRCIVENNGIGELSDCVLTPASPPADWVIPGGPNGVTFIF